MKLKHLWKIGVVFWIFDLIVKHYTNSLGYRQANTVGGIGAFMTGFFGIMRLATVIHYRNNKKLEANPTKRFQVARLLIAIGAFLVLGAVITIIGLSQL